MKNLTDQVLKINLSTWTKWPYFNTQLLTNIALILTKYFHVVSTYLEHEKETSISYMKE